MKKQKVKNIEDIYDLSPMQQGMLFHTLYTPESGVYVTQLMLRLNGALNRSAFKEAWQEVVARHPVLRTFFVWQGRQKPLQIVRRQVDLPWIEHDWHGVAEQEKQLETLLMNDREQGFSLQKAPLMRFYLIELAQDRYQFVWSSHHLLMDGWSLPLVVKEVWAFYESADQGRSLYLPSPRPYGDYMVWLAQQDYEGAQRYWRKVLEGFTAPTPLVVDHRASVHDLAAYSEHQVSFSSNSTAALQKMAALNRLTTNTIIQGAWALLLSRYSGQEEVLFGATVSGRPPSLSGVETMVGLFINTLPVRVTVPTDMPLVAWLSDLQEQQREREQYAYSPLIDIQGWSEIPRGIPLFESLLVYENYPLSGENWQERLGLQVTNTRSVEQTNYPLTVAATLTESYEGAQLHFVFSYDRSRFEHDTISCMAGHLQTLLSGIVANPDQPIAHLPLLTEDEKHQLLVEWNDTQADYSSDKCIYQLFEAQVARTPEAIALVAGGQQLTYRELNARANQLAHYLIAQGVGPDVLVGICVERSIEMVVGLLGILKAGGAYVPLDLSYPQQRLALMLEDASVSLLLTQQQLLQSLPPTTVQLVCLDSDWPQIGKQSSNNLFIEIKPDNLAYVIYTSGSTGTPKGVLVQHDNVVRLLSATEPWFGFNESDVWTLFHSVAFDFSVWEIWGALLYGGRLVVVPYFVSRSPELFYQLLCEQGVTVLNQTPSAFKQLIQYEESRSEPEALALRFVIFGGEALEFASLQSWFSRHGSKSPQLINMYGITETTVHVTYRPITPADLTQQASLIGQPIPDLQLYILDAHQQLVPIGIPGELYVGGAGVSRGYLNRQTLTAARFVKIDSLGIDNYSPRLYRTGDLVRRLPDGDIEYMGRIDNQVKIRGFRIELGEIEAVLAQHPNVRSALVLAQEDKERHRYLVGYIIARHETSVTISQLRAYLSQRLPDYMIPATLIPLDRMPLTANGKIDRQALPQPNQLQSLPSSQYVPPRTAREALLVDIFSDVLHHKVVGIHDNFFALGGDSILSIQVLTRIKKAGLALSLQQLFQHQTVYKLARVLSESTELIHQPTPFSLISDEDRQRLPADIEDAYPLAALQMGMLFYSEYDLEHVVYHNVSSIKLKAHFSAEAWQLAIQKLIERHSILRTSFDLSHYSTPLQLVHRSGLIRLEIEDLRHLSSDEQESKLEALFESEKKNYFEWHHPSLLRFHIQRLDQEVFQLTFAEHHAILDGWSVASLIRELFQYYHALVKQLPSYDLPPLEQDYRSFIALERAAINNKAHQAYWQDKLADASILTLPNWYPFDKNRERSGESGSLEIEIDATLSASIKAFARSAGAPVKSVLLAAHMRVLSIFGGQSDVLTGLVMNGRPEEAEGTQVLGLFLNTAPFRLHLDGGTWQELVQQVFQAECDLLPVRRYPLAEVQRQQGGHELFNVIFNFVHFHVYQKMSVVDEIEFLGGQFFQKTNFALGANFSLNPLTGQINLDLAYDPEKLPLEQVQTIAQYYKRALMAMVDEPKAKYNDISLLSESERYQILAKWNDTATDYSQDKCIHQLFEEQVERTPQAIALVFDEQQLTYHELNARANQLACYLQRLGVGAETLVGCCLESSIEMVVGLLGILKAGGAYVPLSPTYPQERLAFMLQNAQISVLLTQEHLRENLPSSRVQVVALDSDWPLIASQNSDDLTRQVQPGNLAYVIYTSGSTGQPKCAGVYHYGFTNLVCWFVKKFGLAATDRVLVTSSFSFDLTQKNFFAPLLVGGQLHLSVAVPYEYDAMREHISKYQITWLNCTPSAFYPFIDFGSQKRKREQLYASLASLRYIFLGGEPISMSRLQAWRESRHCYAKIVNTYGPTECTDVVASYTIESAGISEESIPIGQPIFNTSLYVLNEYLQPVPINVPGELYIGGICVGRGYLNDPRQTNAKFIPNPFSSKEHRGRLYKTGDLARWRADGNIEFLGRTDYQVKIRGFRIELGEIEAALNSLIGVREAVVVAREEASRKRLVAYVVQELKSTPESEVASVLRKELSQKLPDYMIPAVFVSLERMPLTPNGKIDRRALPAPEIKIDSAQLVLPRTPVETMLATIWQEVLGLEQVGMRDNFFELGGDSIISIQIVSRAREAGINITPRDLFQHQTIGELASVARAAQTTDAEQGVVTGTLPLTPVQHRFFEQAWSEPHHFNQSVLLELSQEINPTWLSQAVEALLAHHDALRLRFERLGDSWQQAIVAPEASVPFEVIELTAYSIDEQEAMQEAMANQLQASLNLSQGPLLRVALFQSSFTTSLLIVIHHLVVDGVSWRILLEDLQRAYQQVASDSSIQLPAKSTSFKQWATLLNEKGPSVLEVERDYWAQVNATQALPIDYRLGPNDNASAATISTRLDRARTEALLNEVPAVYHTQINDLLLTALLLAYARWTGERALLLNLEGHGREELFEVDLSRTVGWFTTIFPVRLELTTFDLGETIKHVKEQLRSIPNRGIGYGVLRHLSDLRRPDFEAEIIFNYLGQFDQSAKGSLILGFASGSSGSEYSPSGPRPQLLDINGMVIKGQLQVDWTYSQNFHRAQTIQKLADRFIETLQALIAHCKKPEAGGYTPSDFSAATVNQKKLDKLMTRIKRR